LFKKLFFNLFSLKILNKYHNFTKQINNNKKFIKFLKIQNQTEKQKISLNPILFFRQDKDLKDFN